MVLGTEFCTRPAGLHILKIKYKMSYLQTYMRTKCFYFNLTFRKRLMFFHNSEIEFREYNIKIYLLICFCFKNLYNRNKLNQ